MQWTDWMGVVTEAMSASQQRPPAPALPNVIFGFVLVVVGVVTVVRRKRIYKGTVRAEKKWFGRGLGEFLERSQSPIWIGAAGVFAVLLGVSAVTYGVWRLLTPAS